jgi:MerR family transcriptional regulator, light-induced transcriptional regulator
MHQARGRRPRPPVPAVVQALLRGDRAAAREATARFVAATGASRAAVIADLLQPAQHEIGELWYRGQIGVAEEHRATAIVEAVLEDLPPTPSSDPVAPGSRCLLATVGTEQHRLGLRALELVLEDDGWSVDRMSSPLPLPELLRHARRERPDVVCLSAAYLPSLRDMQLAVAALKAERLRVIVGGPAFVRVPLLWKRIGADAHAGDGRVATVLMRRLLRA